MFGEIIKGGTPLHEFEFPFDASLIKTVEVTYSQCGKNLLVKNTEDCTFDGQTVTVSLSQEDTFLFDENYLADAHIRVVLHDGGVIPSEVMPMFVRKCLSNEVLK